MSDDYGVYIDGQHAAVELWPRTAEGAITATTRAARLSRGGAAEVRRDDGRMIARFVNGRRDMPPGGIVHMVEAKAAGGE